MSLTYVPCDRCEKINRVSLGRAEVEQPVCGSCAAVLPIEHGVVKLTGGSLQHLLRSLELPVVVDFWAQWCVPCRAFEPEFQQAAKKYAGRAILGKIDTQEQFLAASAYGIRSVPTLIFFHHGNEVERQFGAISSAHLSAWLDSRLK
jgi:thioredoxin 2